MTESKEALHIIGDIEVAKLKLAPGDILVARADRPITAQQADRLREGMKRVLPDGVKCMVIDPRLELSVLTRAEIEAKAV